MATNHPIQGENFPSKKFCKYYEFYPDVEINSFWDVPIFGDYRVIRVTFIYDYRKNRAEVQMGRREDVEEMQSIVPGFGRAIGDIIASRDSVGIVPPYGGVIPKIGQIPAVREGKS